MSKHLDRYFSFSVRVWVDWLILTLHKYQTTQWACNPTALLAESVARKHTDTRTQTHTRRFKNRADYSVWCVPVEEPEPVHSFHHLSDYHKCQLVPKDAKYEPCAKLKLNFPPSSLVMDLWQHIWEDDDRNSKVPVAGKHNLFIEVRVWVLLVQGSQNWFAVILLGCILPNLSLSLSRIICIYFFLISFI